jgi:cellulose biosynthesis protein BcsQ
MPVALEPVRAMPPLVVVAHDDPATADSLRHAVETVVGWRVLVADPSPAGMAAAIASGPSVALVGCDALGNLPADCPTPLIAVGVDDRPADVRAALATGARSLLAWPDGAADLPGELARVAAIDGQDGQGGGLVVAARGVQGGAGTTTVAVHLAAAWARWGPAPVLLVDLAGGLAFRLDLGAVTTWSTLVPTGRPGRSGPDRPAADLPGSTAGRSAQAAVSVDAKVPGSLEIVDSLESLDSLDAFAGRSTAGGAFTGRSTAADAFAGRSPAADAGGAPLAGSTASAAEGSIAAGWSLDAPTLVGAVAEPWAGLAVLPLAGLADGVADPPPEPWVAQTVLEVARTAYRLVVVDLPAADGPAVQTALSQADALVAVGRCETAGVRGLQAALDAWTAAGRDPDTAGAVVTGVRPQAPLAAREVRAVLGDRLWGLIPAAVAELAAAAEDGILLVDRHDLPAVQAMLTLANRVVPFAAISA